MIRLQSPADKKQTALSFIGKEALRDLCERRLACVVQLLTRQKPAGILPFVSRESPSIEEMRVRRPLHRLKSSSTARPPAPL